jgi:hypothetical protein
VTGKLKRNKDTPENKGFWERVEETTRIREQESNAIDVLRKLEIQNSARAFLDLLSDEVELKKVVAKLKLKAFW